MEKEQLEKKVEWLDSERRKALETVAALEKRLAHLETSQPKQVSTVKTLNTYKAKLDSLEESFTALEKQLKAQQSETKKEFQDFEKQRKGLEKTFEQEQKGLNKVLEDFRQEIGQLQALQKSLNTQGDKLQAVGGKVDSLEESIQTVITGEQKRAQLALSLETSSKQDAKRLTEMQGEVAAMLSRVESSAKQTQGVSVAMAKVEKSMQDLVGDEVARQTEHDAFLEKASLAQMDRERQWKEWGKRFDVIEAQSGQIGEQLKSIETTDIALKRAQKAFDDLVEKIDRRVNELSEIQRLGDQRFRQEWSTFQADAQKRWANFTLSHEEQQREGQRQRDKLAVQLNQLEDNLRDAQDTVQHLGDQSERTLQAMLEMARDALAENERFVSNSR